MADWNNIYVPTDWSPNDIIRESMMDRIEFGIQNVDEKTMALLNMVAPVYNPDATYAPGNYATYNGELYYCASTTNNLPSRIGWEQIQIMDTLANVDSEVFDIRTGADGTTYGSAGEAVRRQIEDIISKMPAAPEVNGTYILQCNVNNNEITYEWINA